MTPFSTPKRGVLRCIEGHHHRDQIKLRGDGTILGREKADIIIADREVSATHLQIQWIGDQYCVFDMNSSNGTFVNDERVVKRPLVDGDRIRLGSTTFLFALVDEAEVRNVSTLFSTSKRALRSTQSFIDTVVEHDVKSSTRCIIIEVTYHKKHTEIIRIQDSSVTIGRASSFGRFDQDVELSRKHVMIKANDSGEVFIHDQGSSNGTFVNKQKISGILRILPTDEIEIGRCHLRIRVNS